MTKRTSQPVRLIGKGMPRVDADGKVRGTTRYLNDIDYKGVYHGVVVRAPVPRGILKAVTPDPAFDWTGITFATAADIPGENVVHMHDRTMPLLAAIGGEIRYRGEPVGVVAAPTPERAADAARHIRIDRVFEPNPDLRRLYDDRFALFTDLHRRLGPLYRRLNGAEKPERTRRHHA